MLRHDHARDTRVSTKRTLDSGHSRILHIPHHPVSQKPDFIHQIPRRADRPTPRGNCSAPEFSTSCIQVHQLTIKTVSCRRLLLYQLTQPSPVFNLVYELRSPRVKSMIQLFAQCRTISMIRSSHCG